MEILHDVIKSANKDEVKKFVALLETMCDDDVSILQMTGLSEEQLKKLSSRDRVKLDSILKMLFSSSHKLFLGTIDYLYRTNYREEYLNGELKSDQISFLPTEFVRDTIDFTFIRADIILKIKDSIYQIEIQTSHDNMAIRLVRYGIEVAISNWEVNPETNIYKITLPEQAVIYLSDNKTKKYSNDYEMWYKNEKVCTVEVPELRLWEIDTDDVMENKLYNLLPVLIFNYRKKLLTIKPENREELKQEFIGKVNEILRQLDKINTTIEDRDAGIIIAVLGELMEYFDKEFFDGQISEEGVTKMTFSQQIMGYIEDIENAKKECDGVKNKLQQAEEDRKNMVLNMINKSMDTKLISEITGLSVGEIEKIAKK